MTGENSQWHTTATACACANHNKFNTILLSSCRELAGYSVTRRSESRVAWKMQRNCVLGTPGARGQNRICARFCFETCARNLKTCRALPGAPVECASHALGVAQHVSYIWKIVTPFAQRPYSPRKKPIHARPLTAQVSASCTNRMFSFANTPAGPPGARVYLAMTELNFGVDAIEIECNAPAQRNLHMTVRIMRPLCSICLEATTSFFCEPYIFQGMLECTPSCMA